KGPKRSVWTGTELGNSPSAQLYDLGSDLGETNNLDQAHPDRSRQLRDELNATRKTVGTANERRD
ncbi:MAG TPA: arylsulfatase, partial [Verrucomicrobiae bacterium]|nr:arylsulfatase [Verrucomicrobiae bacterium]